MGVLRRATALAVPASGALTWLAVLILAAPASSVAGRARWTTVPIGQPAGLAQPNGNGALFGNLACLNATDCWTAGFGVSKTGADIPFIEHWNGKSFKLVATPDSKSFLQGVACASSRDCWAAGGAGTPPTAFGQVGKFVPLLDRYRGSKWTAVRPPNPGGAPDDELSDVSCASGRDCYAVGWTRSTQSERTLIEFWNGKRWRVASHAALAGQRFSAMVGVDCPSKCIAVGVEEATKKDPPHVVGEIQVPHRVHVKGHRDRRVPVWESVSMPSPKAPNDYTAVNGISCPALNDCLATGSAYFWPADGLDPGKAVAWHWNGRDWSLIMPHLSGPRGGGDVNQLSDISCWARRSCWAVGGTFTDTAKAPAVTAYWNGAKFSEGSNENPYADNHLDAVGCAKHGKCVSVGWGGNSSGGVHPIALELPG